MNEPVPPAQTPFHSLLYITAFKVNDLGVLAAQLDGNICLGSVNPEAPLTRL